MIALNKKVFFIRGIYNLNLNDSIIIDSVRYNIFAKIRFSNIDEKRDVVRYYIKREKNKNDIYILELESGKETIYLATEFTGKDFLEKKALEKKRLMIGDAVGIQHYEIASCIYYKRYVEDKMIIVIEEGLSKKHYFKGWTGDILDITIVNNKNRDKNLNVKHRKINMVETKLIKKQKNNKYIWIVFTISIILIILCVYLFYIK